MRYLPVLGAVTVFAATLGPLPAGGESETPGCVSGPAAHASAERPHIVDPEGDLHHSSGDLLPGGEDAYDITVAWVSQEDDPEPGEEATFAANVAVVGLDEHPVGAAYYANFTGSHWVSARALATGDWQFSWGNQIATGPVFGAIRQARGEATGTVDVDEGVISVVLPAHLVPQPRADGREVVLPTLVVRTGTPAAAPVSVGAPENEPPSAMVTADTTLNAEVCTVVLYEEFDPDELDG